MLGGGLVPGTNTLLLGPSGAGKTTTAVSCLLAALQRGQRATYYLFDEGVATLLARSRSLGMELEPYRTSGQLVLRQIDPAEMSPGQFANSVMQAVQGEGSSFVVIDSLNAYFHAMPGQSFLQLHVHELMSFLNQQGVITLLVVGQHGLMGEMRSEIDLSYLSDSLLMFRLFEADSEVRTAVSAMKNRTAPNQGSIREFRLRPGHGLEVGQPLRGFEGVMTGLIVYRGGTPMLAQREQ
jgi:circadian clock protein KaiC